MGQVAYLEEMEAVREEDGVEAGEEVGDGGEEGRGWGGWRGDAVCEGFGSHSLEEVDVGNGSCPMHGGEVGLV